MKKRLVSIFLCVAMTAATVLSGCGASEDADGTASKESGSNEKYKEFLTVDVFDTLANYQGIQSGWFGKIVKDKFNMELNIIAPNVAGGGDALFQTRSAAGNLGDLVIVGTQNGRLNDLVKAGLLMDMTDLLKNKAVMKEYEDAITQTKQLTEQDGIYAIPSEISDNSPESVEDGIEPLVSPLVRWDAYKAAGCPEVKTLEDYIPAMKAMQEQVPESDSGKKTYAISMFKDWDDGLMVGAKNYASLYGYLESGFAMAKADGSDIQDVIADEGLYVRSLKFLFDANQEGLVDPESTTQNWDTLANKYRDGQVLTSHWSWQGKDCYNTAENKEAGKGFMPLMIDDMECFAYGCYAQGNTKNMIGIGSKAEDPERMADFIDWLYSPEGMELYQAGPEGLTWEMKDDKAVRTDFGNKALNGEKVSVPEEWGGGEYTDGVSALNFKALSVTNINPENKEPYSRAMWSSELEKNNTPLDLDWQEYTGGAKTTVEFLEMNDALSVSAGTSYSQPEEPSDITTLRNQCKEVIKDSSWKMVFAKDEAEFKSVLKNMQDTVKGLGYDQVLELDIQNAKDEAKAKVKAIEEYNNK
ncbi:extracellular solute-binding protein [Blautia pseudococcoides]|uniref:extracellular solute-binding protein n=1 Tax=Blautia pseudococcoides TaxID=1796616 RepID=UPI00148AFC2F|nr:extracellular solute-binding protein [Blautia pseudococcoides]QJU17226.1 extracellular solute-binding protein [Blautia pseudococcoides]